MRRFPFELAGAIALSVLAHRASSAQTLAPDPGDNARFHLGPVALAPTISLTNFGFDSNVFNAPTSPQGDFTAELTPEVDAWLRAGRLHVSSASLVGWNYFAQAANQRSLDGGEKARANLALVHVTPHVGGEYLTSRQRPNLEIDARVRHTTSGGDAGVTLDATSRLSLDLDASTEAVRYDDPEFATFLDETTRQATVTARFAMTPLTSLVVTGARLDNRFDLSPDRNSTGTTFSAGLEFQPLALVRGTATIGHASVTPETAGLPAFHGLTANGDLVYTLDDSLRTEVTVSRGLEYSFEAGAYYYIATGAMLEVTKMLGAGWDVVGRFGRTNLAYPGVDVVIDGVEGSPAETDRVGEIGIGGGRHLGSDVRVGVDVTHIQRQSPIAGRSYAGYSVGGTVTYGH